MNNIFSRKRIQVRGLKKIEFRSFDGGYCAFTDSSIILSDSKLTEGRVYPFGSIARLSARSSLKIVTHSGETAVFSMRYLRKRSKLKIRELVKDANKIKGSFDKSAPSDIEIDEAKKTKIEKIHIPHLSKKNVIKFWFITACIICALLILACLTVGWCKSKEEYNPPTEDVKLSWEALW